MEELVRSKVTIKTAGTAYYSIKRINGDIEVTIITDPSKVVGSGVQTLSSNTTLDFYLSNKKDFNPTAVTNPGDQEEEPKEPEVPTWPFPEPEQPEEEVDPLEEMEEPVEEEPREYTEEEMQELTNPYLPEPESVYDVIEEEEGYEADIREGQEDYLNQEEQQSEGV